MQRKAIKRIIALFGGLRATAVALGHANPTTVQGWKERDKIPSHNFDAIIEAAKRVKGVQLTYADFFDGNGAK